MKLVQNIKDYDSIPAKLITKREMPGGLVSVKYSRAGMWANEWDNHPLLKQARGHVFSATTGDILVRPFDKVFHPGENEVLPDRDSLVVAVRKVNGYMAALTVVDSDHAIVSTTGASCHLNDDSSSGNEFLRNFSEKINPFREWFLKHFKNQITFIFEVVDSAFDPHIVPEFDGLYLIGARNVVTGELWGEESLDKEAEVFDFKRPEWIHTTCDAVLRGAESPITTHEGFVVRASEAGRVLFKVKSSYYAAAKILARMKKPDEKNPAGEVKLIRAYELYPMFKIMVDETVNFFDLEEQDRLKALGVKV